VNVFHKGDSGTVGVVLRVFERRRFKPVRLDERKVRGVPPRGLVGDIALRHRRREAVGVGNDPVGENAAAAAAGHRKFFRVDIATLQEFVHVNHQVAVIVTRIVILNGDSWRTSSGREFRGQSRDG
jgi:hypothetical protein